MKEEQPGRREVRNSLPKDFYLGSVFIDYFHESSWHKQVSANKMLGGIVHREEDQNIRHKDLDEIKMG